MIMHKKEIIKDNKILIIWIIKAWVPSTYDVFDVEFDDVVEVFVLEFNDY